MRIRTFPEREAFRQMSTDATVVPLCAEILADTETPVSLLRKFMHRGEPLVLLESVEGGERWGRYSFLVTSARSHLRVFRDRVTIETQTGPPETVDHGGDPFSVLREEMGAYRPAVVEGLPRFWGGLVGYMTYEAVSFIEEIPNRWPENRPLAHFIVPDELVIFDNVRHTLMAVASVFPGIDGDPDTVYVAGCDRLRDLVDAIERPAPEADAGASAVPSALHAVLSEERFRENVQIVKDYIHAGDVIQTVIAQPFVCETPPDLWNLYRAQRYVNPSPYLFFMKLGDMALVGSSPETMVRLESGTATVRPIAGTRPRGGDEQTDRALADELLADEKERAEHLMLVDLGRNDLGRVAQTGSVQVTDLMVVERYSHVMHLVSNVRCDLKDGCDAWDLIRATFPAGTLSGAPKIRAMEIIAELEDEPRGAYGGAVGYVSFSGNLDLAITIRTACVEDGRLTVKAGAGIVADSDPERERMETVNKARAIQRALELVQEQGEMPSCS